MCCVRIPTGRVWRAGDPADAASKPRKAPRHRRRRRRARTSVAATVRDFATPRLQFGPSQPADRTMIILGEQPRSGSADTWASVTGNQNAP